MSPKLRALLLCAPFLALGLASPRRAAAQPCDFSAGFAVVQGIVDSAAVVTGASLSIQTADGSVDQSTYFGNFDATTVVPIASASKLLSAVAILSLVDDDLIDLDAPVSTYLPQFVGLKGTMTMRQMFSHTSGLPGGSNHSVLSDDTLTLAQAADQIACCIPLAATPGTQFAYGGLSMHAAGHVAEVVTGQSWATLFAERVATPLGLTDTDYYGFGFTTNPRVAGGARSSLSDYSRVLEMLLNDGLFGGQRVLSRAAVDTMFADQTFGVPIVSSPAPAGVRYGIGVWRNLVGANEEPIRVSSPGAFGFTPWVDVELGAAGVLQIFYSNSLITNDVELLQSAVGQEIAACVPSIGPFQRGDVNQDATVDIADVVALLGYLFPSAPPVPLACADALDANDDGELDVSDPVRLLTLLFGSGNAPLPIPGALVCGRDDTPDELGCLGADACP